MKEEKKKEDNVSDDIPKSGEKTPEVNDTDMANSKKLFTHKDKGYRVGFLSAKKVKNDDGAMDWEDEGQAKERLSSLFEMDVDHSWNPERKGFVASQSNAPPKVVARNKKGETEEAAVERVSEDHPDKDVEFEDPDTPPPAAPSDEGDDLGKEKKDKKEKQ